MTACLISTLINMIVLDRVFTKVYMINIKQAFSSQPPKNLIPYEKRETETLMQVTHDEVEGFVSSIREEGEGKTSAQ
jgi:hypothetical protein